MLHINELKHIFIILKWIWMSCLSVFNIELVFELIGIGIS